MKDDLFAGSKKDLLCRAITDKRLVQFKCDGRSRIVEPFLRRISTTENYVLRGFQVRGLTRLNCFAGGYTNYRKCHN